MPENQSRSNSGDIYGYARSARLDLAKVLDVARERHHLVLAYLIKVVIAELRNIEKGRPTKV
jgi:hypothetical protein